MPALVPLLLAIIGFAPVCMAQIIEKKSSVQILSKQRQLLLQSIVRVHGLTPEVSKQLAAIFGRSDRLGQGNPLVTKHPVSEQQCLKKVGGIAKFDVLAHQKICKDRFMAPVYDSIKQQPNQAEICIDQFEFPNIPCSYPVVWVRAHEAAAICETLGKRLCDAHEWEDACAGSVQPPDWLESDDAKVSSSSKQLHAKQRRTHNRQRTKIWSYGSRYDSKICGMGSQKSPGCNSAHGTSQDAYDKCGSNTYPSGYFPACRSAFGVYDQHGNAAEHMNLALTRAQAMRSGGSGLTEMKGSWFVFGSFRAHSDDCRWRAPFWHGSTISSSNSHRYYHLGFRCCKTLSSVSLKAPNGEL